MPQEQPDDTLLYSRLHTLYMCAHARVRAINQYLLQTLSRAMLGLHRPQKLVSNDVPGVIMTAPQGRLEVWHETPQEK